MCRYPIRTVVAGIAICVTTLSNALPRSDAPGDPAPKPVLLTPPPKGAAAPAPAPDTAALLPSGDYVLSITWRHNTISGPAAITRQGQAVTATLGVNETLSGTLDAKGQLQLAGGSGADRMSLTGLVQNRRGSGAAQAGRGATVLNGSFSLDPVTGARAKKMKTWETDQPSPATPKPAGECGFWCRVGKWLGL